MILFIYIICKSYTCIWFISVVYKNLVVVQSTRLGVSAVPILCWTLVWADNFRVTDFQVSLEPSPSNRRCEFASRSENEQVKGKGFFLQSPLMWATARSYSSDFERVFLPQIIWLWQSMAGGDSSFSFLLILVESSWQLRLTITCSLVFSWGRRKLHQHHRPTVTCYGIFDHTGKPEKKIASSCGVAQP